jgi:hypothetical protein
MEQEIITIDNKEYNLNDYTFPKWLSPTSITSYLENQEGWFKDKILRIPKRSIYLTGGSGIHQFMEDFFSDTPTKDDDILSFKNKQFDKLLPTLFDFKDQNGELFSDLIDEMTEEGITVGEKLNYTREDVLRWINFYFDRWLVNAIADEKKKGTKYAWKQHSPFKNEMQLEISSIRVHGFVDAYYKDYWHAFSETVGNMVVDYKTSKQSAGTNYTNYILQMKIYSLMIREIGDKVSWMAIDFIKTGDKHIIPVNDDMLDKTKELILRIWKEIEEKGMDYSLYLNKKDSMKHTYLNYRDLY